MGAEENYKALRAELDERLSSNKQLAAIAEKISAGKADFSDTARYSQIVSHIMGDVISQHIGEITVPLGKQMVCKELLKDHYKAINDILGEVQASVDDKLGIHLNPVKAPFPTERVDTAAHSLEDPTVPEETIKRRARSTTENIANSMHDDYIKENAKTRTQAGLKCYLVRDAGGGCCKWCQGLEGRFDYATAPDDIFRRHDNCTCSVTYECGRQRQDVWSKKTWEATPEELQARKEAEAASKPVMNTKEQAKELEARVLDKSGESGIIDLQKQLVNLGFDSIDQSFFNNVNKEMQHSIIDQLSYLENKFSAIGNSNKITISANLRGGATACVRSELNSPNNQKLMLSSRDFKNRKRHISNRKKEVEDFFCMPCNMDEETLSRYVITHEYGHMLENTIAAQDMRGTINTFPRLTANYKEQIERIARTIDPDYDSNKSKYISKYVREEVPNGKKDLEFFAECFANSQLGQPNVLGQAMLQWLEKRGF